MCPFYINDADLVIRCEGPFTGCRHITVKFKEVEQCTAHFKKYCRSMRYKECSVFKAIHQKYEEDEDARDGL